MSRKPILQPKKQKQQKNPDTLKNYVKYSTLAFQMGFIILAGVFGGQYLDHLIGWEFPVLTLILSVLSVIGAIYIAIKDFIHFK